MKKSDSNRVFLLEKIEESRHFTHITASGPALLSAGQQLAVFGANSTRGGAQPYAWVNGGRGSYSLCPKSNRSSEELVPLVLTALIYGLWNNECHEKWNESCRPSKNSEIVAIMRVLLKEGVRYHPAVDLAVDALFNLIQQCKSVMDLIMDDMRGPLHIAIKKGADRDDLIRMVDEAIAEAVMKA